MTVKLQLCAFPTGEGMFNLSPFCTKADILLKMAEVDYELVVPEDFKAYSKQKLPVLIDAREVIEDSEMIRAHLEQKHGANFSRHLAKVQRAIGHSLCRMVEERTRYALLHARWATDDGWAQTKAIFFAQAPDEIANAVRERVRETLYLDGFGRHSDAEIKAFVREDLSALSIILGSDDWFFGREPSFVDACVLGLLANFYASPIKTWTADMVAEFATLKAYVERGLARWYPASHALLMAA